MIFLATDFGLSGPYVGQVKAVLARLAPGTPAIDLISNLPAFQPKPAAYLLAAYARLLEPGDVLLAVVDPGVGGDRQPMMMRADDRWYVGPDNGLFELIRRRARAATSEAITWRPDHLSASFHGRDLFAPVAAALALGKPIAGKPLTPIDVRWPDDLAAIVYTDHYGNAVSGLRASGMAADAVIEIGGEHLEQARTFSDRALGAAFWYENANGLVEIAVNGGSAAERFGLEPGVELRIRTPG
ncbi:MAG: SAM-dependent chlorinase/fluorinase [Alphaproteobacteria bacterium]|nr:SAM-dependent chlorinase/fluorinase [Alphaproteobacteria bacterium]